MENKILVAKEILKTKTYLEMEPDEEKIVIEYETEKYKKRITKLLENHTKNFVENKIHEWWADYLMHDETEIILYHFLDQQTKEKEPEQ